MEAHPLALPALLGSLLLGAAAQPSVRYAAHSFADCNAAALYAADHPAVGQYGYRIAAKSLSAKIVEVPGLGFRGTARIQYYAVAADSTMILPRWTWTPMTSAQTQAQREFLDELRNHELGHRAILERALRGRQSTIVVLGTSHASARERLNAALVRQLRSLEAEISQSQQTYDRVTDHGRRQGDGPLYGYRGGPAVVFSCG